MDCSKEEKLIQKSIPLSNKEDWIERLFLRRKVTVVLLSYLPTKTLLRLFRIVQQAVCWYLLLFFLYHEKEYIAEESQVTEARLIEESN